MEQNLEAPSEQMGDNIQSVRQQQQPPPARPASPREKSLQEKLYDIYVEECEEEPEAEGLQSSLLEKLMARETLPCLVVSLYPGNPGYSLMIKDKSGSLSETFQVPYEVEKLLRYLDAGELPSLLIDVLENSPVNIVHHGCVIAEIRDYRQCGDPYPSGEPGPEPTVPSPAYQSRHILLHLTTESLVSDNHQWTQEEKLQLESQLLLTAEDPPYLDPSVAVTCTADRLLFDDQNMDTDPMRQCFKRPACPFLDQQEVPFGCTCPPEVTSMTPFRKQAKIRPDSPSDLKIDEAWKESHCELTVPLEMDMQTFVTDMPSLPFDEAEPIVSTDPEVKYGCMFDYEDDSQLWDMNPGVLKTPKDPLFSDVIEPLPEDRSDNDMYLPPMSLDNYSGDFMAGINTEPRQTVDVCQEPVQSNAVCPGEMPQGSSSSVCLPQPSLDTNPTTSLVASSVLEKENETSVPGSQGSLPGTSIAPPAARIIPPVPRTTTVIRQTIVEVSRVSTLSPADRPTAGPSENNRTIQRPTTTTGVNVIHLVRSLPNASSLVNNSTQVLGRSASATAAEDMTQNSLLPIGEPSPGPALRPVKPPMQVIINNTASPLTVKLPAGSVILRPEAQKPSQGQLQQPEQIYVLIPKQQQQPRAPAPQQPQPVPPASSEVSNQQQLSLPVQHTSRINIEQTERINTVGGRVVQQTQTSVVCHVDSTQQSHGQNVHSQSFQVSATLVQEGPTQTQNLEVRIIPGIVTVSTAGTQYSERGHAPGEPSDREMGGSPTTPRP
ncbi:transcription factor SPT20-like [Sigmodon hispidus]